MALIDYERRAVEFKIVYHGPPNAGKASCIRYIHENLDPPAGQMVTLRTGADSTIYFEFLASDVSVLEGFETHVQIFTVPGMVELNIARQLVLRDADAVVFVVDSRWEAVPENVASLANLAFNLKHLQLDLDLVPLVLQYHKRDLSEIAPTNYLDFVLNRRKRPAPAFETSSTTGGGLFPALNMALALAVRAFEEG